LPYFKNHIFILIIIAITISFQISVFAEEQKNPVETVVTNTITSIANMLIKQASPKEIEEFILSARKNGAIGYKFDRYSFEKAGWTLSDSKGRDVQRVIFSFTDQKAQEAKYLGPLSAFQDSKVVHKWHTDVMDTYYKKRDTNNYNIGNGCIANIELFKGSSGLGRTIIVIKFNWREL
jgi:hypothetical protein